MDIATLKDLKIVEGDIASTGGALALLHGAGVVAQDLRHALLGGELFGHLAEGGGQAALANTLTEVVLADDRIDPNTVEVHFSPPGRWQVEAQTMEGEPIALNGETA